VKVFAERLRELRQEKGLSMMALSKAIGIGDASISRWENCQAIVNGEQLVVLAKFFGVSTDYLLGLTN